MRSERSGGADPAEDAYSAVRDRLFGIAYRMTGSVADAEDICQESWLRWQRVDHPAVDNPEAYLVRITTRLAIDRSTTAHARRETYPGPYLPEPILEGALADSQPEVAAELADSLTFAFLVMLDELNPQERAAFLLREVFGYGYDDIASAIDKSSEAVRQIVSRTRRKLDVERVDVRRADPDHERHMLESMVGALLSGDAAALMELLSPDVVHLGDGGANRHAGRRPVVGPDRVARMLVNLAKRPEPGTTLEFARVNGTAAIVLRVDGRPDFVQTVEFAPDGRIRRMFGQLNPDKLGHLS